MAKSNSPNIVLINCDDLGYGDISCYGSKKHSTPAIDNLAEQGIRFTDFYVSSPVCSPSRGSLMTGCYPSRIGFDSFNGNAVLFPGDEVGLSQKEKTLPSILKDVGYNTMHIGKWHCGDQPEFLPCSHGFDRYYGIPYSNDMGLFEKRKTRPPLPLMKDSEVIQEQPDQKSLIERYTEKSIQFIQSNKNNPFFLYLAHTHVHLPLYAPDYFEKRAKTRYEACVLAIDWSTKVIIHELKKRGLYDNTIIIFTSDNGSRNDFGESNGALRGKKGDIWDGGMRVPCIIHWPNQITPHVSHELVTSMDLLPTLKSLCGNTTPLSNHIDGIEMVDTFIHGAPSKRTTLAYYLKDTLCAVRYKNYKLHLLQRVTTEDGDQFLPVTELYNLSDDIGENKNIYDTHNALVQEIKKVVIQIKNDLGDAYSGVLGAGCREIGRVTEAQPLTIYDESYPYLDAFYDRYEFG